MPSTTAPAPALEVWTGYQVAWPMARGYPGAFGRKVNAPYVWIPLCVLFLLPFFDWRRPFRLLHLDLLVLLGFRRLARLLQPRRDRHLGAAGLPGAALPAGAHAAGRLRPRAPRAGRCVPLVAGGAGSRSALSSWSASGSALNVADSNVIDVGYSGVIGADRIAARRAALRRRFPTDNRARRHLRAGQLLRLRPVRAGLPAGRAAGTTCRRRTRRRSPSTCSTIGVLFLLGRRCGRAGGTALGVALAFAWAAYPYTLFALETNSNDALVARLVGCALLACARRSPVGARRRVGARRGGQVRAAGARAAVRAHAARRRSRARRTVAAGSRSSRCRGRVRAVRRRDGGAARALGPHARLPGRRDSPFSVWGQDASALAADRWSRRAASCSPCWSRSCRGAARLASSPRSARRC